jgi:hypothetical protein
VKEAVKGSLPISVKIKSGELCQHGIIKFRVHVHSTTLVLGVIIPKHFLEYSALIGESVNSTLRFC